MMICSNCNVKNDIDARFCYNCGNHLDDFAAGTIPLDQEDDETTIPSFHTKISERERTIVTSQDEVDAINPHLTTLPMPSDTPTDLEPTPYVSGRRNVIFVIVIGLLVMGCMMLTGLSLIVYALMVGLPM
ncbi:zinc ribbon domain-containing protein [Anaerolineales bacterium HSG24]|nr:zinc ribbon domain-containing protein [Anaerolineales bacterium HSG24]